MPRAREGKDTRPVEAHGACIARRAPGTGSVVWYRGAYRARLPRSLGRDWLPERYETREAANDALDYAISELIERGELAADGRPTWATLAHEWLPQQAKHNRAYVSAVERIARAPWTRDPVQIVTRADVLRWLDEHTKEYAPNTVKQDLTVASLVFTWAMDREIIVANPALRARKGARLKARDAWTYLSRDELRALFAHDGVRDADKAIVRFWIGTGLRPGEWRSLRLDDVTPEGVRVRIGREEHGEAGPTKGRRIRLVPWIPIARRGWEEWLSWECSYSNARKLAFPGLYGGINDFWMKRRLPEIMRMIGVTRRFRPHDLRHTCGAALASGYFGHRWRLEVIRDFLGHASITETQRYAHLACGTLVSEAGETGDFV